MGYRDYATAKGHIVDANGHGDFTTIGAALTAASSGQTIFIMPGTYAENPTLKAGVNLAAYDCDALTPNVTINGKCTFTGAGTVTISGIQLQTNSDYLLAVTGSAASIVYLKNCYLNCLNNTGINYTNSNGSSSINLIDCYGNIGTTGIGLFTASSAGFMRIQYSYFTNTGGSTTASTISSGSMITEWCVLPIVITTSSTSTFESRYCDHHPANAIPLTIGGSTTNNISHCKITGGSASGVSVGTGSTVYLYQCDINSSNTNAITGLGTLNAGIITFIGPSSTINTSTVNKLTTYGGTIV